MIKLLKNQAQTNSKHNQSLNMLSALTSPIAANTTTCSISKFSFLNSFIMLLKDDSVLRLKSKSISKIRSESTTKKTDNLKKFPTCNLGISNGNLVSPTSHNKKQNNSKNSRSKSNLNQKLTKKIDLTLNLSEIPESSSKNFHLTNQTMNQTINEMVNENKEDSSKNLDIYRKRTNENKSKPSSRSEIQEISSLKKLTSSKSRDFLRINRTERRITNVRQFFNPSECVSFLKNHNDDTQNKIIDVKNVNEDINKKLINSTPLLCENVKYFEIMRLNNYYIDSKNG